MFSFCLFIYPDFLFCFVCFVFGCGCALVYRFRILVLCYLLCLGAVVLNALRNICNGGVVLNPGVVSSWLDRRIVGGGVVYGLVCSGTRLEVPRAGVRGGCIGS